ncbi:GNAT family N-acetyltransferase [Microbispora sp. ATCC PTA-5024]|uniref:GNAT family N-acetyltransferase n=1 Tax=Microbispora sp. ATCC PTA-5024 TaxID=316330 RepID=UPI0003DD6E84|nr:GNAT family N-acetyltransferase [Microbispora sp. ATCC PTA-5024]ETK35285.1 GCN5 family acetyltransferase [Microbispora sp. ATCC PTA-5024]
MPVRHAVPADFDDICDMLLAHAAHEGGTMTLHRDELHETLFGERPVGRALIASAEGSDAAAGCALWYPTFSTWASRRGIWLEDLYVRPECRRLGLGRELLRFLRSLTTGRVEWDVSHGNDAAEAFYRSLGAGPVGGWTRYRWAPTTETPGAETVGV